MTSPIAFKSIREIVAYNVRKLRLSKDVSQEQLAALAGFHRTYVSQVERCVTNISVDNIERLARVLDVESWILLKPSDRDVETEPEAHVGSDSNNMKTPSMQKSLSSKVIKVRKG